MTTVTKKVRARADQILPQFRGQFGVTEEDIAKGKSSRSIVVNPELSIQIGDTLAEAIQVEGKGDQALGESRVLRAYKTQAVTLAMNSERIKFAKAVSDSVKDAEAIQWAFKNDSANAAKICGSGDTVALVNYLEEVKEKIKKERTLAGVATTEEDDDDSNA